MGIFKGIALEATEHFNEFLDKEVNEIVKQNPHIVRQAARQMAMEIVIPSYIEYRIMEHLNKGNTNATRSNKQKSTNKKTKASSSLT